MRKHRMTPFGKYISSALDDKDMTKKELAALIGTSPQYLSYILTGKRSGKKYEPFIIKTLKLDPQKVEKVKKSRAA